MSDAAAEPVSVDAGRGGVRKTYRLYIGGAFVRSESGRTFGVRGADGRHLARAALASARDTRAAVVAARSAFPGWSDATAYRRGQLLYQVAEALDAHREPLTDEIGRATGMPPAVASAEMSAAMDRWIWYVGWSDKIAQVYGGANPAAGPVAGPVAGPYASVSLPEPVGVAALLAPADGTLLGLVSILAPAIVSGNTAVLVASERAPLLAIALAQVLAGAGLPPGVVNVLTGEVAEVSPWLAAHQDVNAIDLAGAPGALADDLAVAAAGTLKRVVRLPDTDWAAEPGPERMVGMLEIKTIWSPLAP